jgi:hypothetical protein
MSKLAGLPIETPVPAAGVHGMLSCCIRVPVDRSHTSSERRSGARDRTWGGQCANATGGLPNATGLPRGTPAIDTITPTVSAKRMASPLGGKAASNGGVVESGGNGHTSDADAPLRNDMLK